MVRDPNPAVNSFSFDDNPLNMKHISTDSSSSQLRLIDQYKSSVEKPKREMAQFGFETDGADGEKLADRYQMLEELGSGSFGVVYKAIEKESGEIVAIKHVDLESSEEDLSDILSELAVLGSCSSSHVTKYRLAFLRRQTLWIVMEYLGGGSCADLLKPPPHSLSESHIAIICRELLIGLSYLHGEGKLHRDIKAANVLLGMDGRVKLADFGVAAQLTGLKSMRNTFVGTPFWMAPEVIQQEGHDAKADVWSLGITAMELAHGEPPHANVHPMKVLFLIPKQPAPRLEGGNWSKDFKDFVSLCLIKDVDHRPTARQLLKHRFVKNATKVEGLQELIQRKQEWEAGRGGERNLRYYAETMKQLKKPDSSNDNDWLFETVKAVPIIDPRGKQTQKRRKVNGVSDVDLSDDATRMMEDLNLERGTSKKVASRADLPDTMKRQGPKKRIPSAQRQPLGVNISFGNSPSTVRQFRRVSPTSDNNASQVNLEKENPLDSLKSPLKLEMYSDPMEVEPPLLSGDRSSPSTSPSKSSTFSSQASTIAVESKEASLGRQLYSNAIGISCQDVLNETGDQNKREAVSRLAEAFSDMEALDPEGMFHIMQGILEKIKSDTKLKPLLPKLSQNPSQIQSKPKIAVIPSDTGTMQKTPSKLTSRLASGSNSPAKLIMAQNNPHLKSHRRRQSTQVTSRDSSGVWSPNGKAADNELSKAMAGVTTLEHTRAMADVMFERWCEGLKVRWPAV